MGRRAWAASPASDPVVEEMLAVFRAYAVDAARASVFDREPPGLVQRVGLSRPVVCEDGWIDIRANVDPWHGELTSCRKHVSCGVHPLVDEAMEAAWRLAGVREVVTVRKLRRVLGGRWPELWRADVFAQWADGVEQILAERTRRLTYG